jgi:hypothetical protein
MAANARWKWLLFVLCLTACSAGGARNLPSVGSPAMLDAGASSEQVIYNFQGGPDGAVSEGTLTEDASGAMYGTTAFGGIYGCTSRTATRQLAD